ncbi:uncharacterized protein EI90DRAFT_3135860 [Cantharellus anzutake]|uniref:uncharacterized protein n=1 Tax=Cantharellus anzutake TaxID=1750568 RepID=UPI001903B210|nr:uncharacterized protein EI90DRAFT_3135860 [Cantharellus anzutake]KAF8314587.1 hypothetical protein EI90DRAFT_3135860 [Cantharellus anzutake]
MIKGSPLKLNKFPSQHQNPVGKLGMGFDSEIKVQGPKAVNEDGLVPQEPIPLVDLNLPIPPIPILVGDDDKVEQVPVPVLAQLAQAITNLAHSTARPTPIPAPVPTPVQPPSTSIQTKV